MNDLQVYSVAEFHGLINQTLGYAYPQVVIEGEVSSFKINQDKWIFFDLKDETTALNCFMPLHSLASTIEDGMLVRIHARPSLTKWGRFSLTVNYVELVGNGDILKSFELLKKKLEKEGLFDTARKRLMPEYPSRIALITSAQAAAYNDFVSILNDRASGLQIDHFQVNVQGMEASSQITSAIEYINKNSDNYDCFVLIRGGGSLEDLQVFSTEPIVRSVFGSQVPSIVAIGHEDDISLAELAADVRAATPSDAARKLIVDRQQLIAKIEYELDIASQRIENILAVQHDIITTSHQAFTNFVTKLKLDIEDMTVNIDNSFDIALLNITHKFSSLYSTLQLLDPNSVLKRGYAIVRVENTVITDSRLVKPNDRLVIQLKKGRLSTKVEKIYD